MARVKPDPPSGSLPEKLADVIERRRQWPDAVEIFDAIADHVDNHSGTVATAAEALGLKREQVYRDYWTPFRAKYQGGKSIKALRKELLEGRAS